MAFMTHNQNIDELVKYEWKKKLHVAASNL